MAPTLLRLAIAGLLVLFVSGVAAPDRAWAQSPLDQCSRSAYSPSERAGCRIWSYAAAGNDRFHTYVFQQRLGVMIDWWRVLKSEARTDRFNVFGLINDPDCCTPGSPGCPARSMEETFGFDFCPGDEELLKFVGKRLIDGKPYRDPGCDFADAPPIANGIHPHPPIAQRQSGCDLSFGTSTGALGLRKFPNPRFDPEDWRRINGGRLGSWKGYGDFLGSEGRDSRVNRLIDGSIEPPFRIGMACGACHIAFDPTRPPADTANPKWENIVNAVGNQYLRMSDILASGMHKSSLEWQLFANARPGTVDTSAVPNDQVQNPGTMNTLINLTKRPHHPARVIRWRGVDSCAQGSDERECWCEPGREDKCWQLREKSESVPNILKGGEDSIGVMEAIQRVYLNIGSCSEACWVNHITDLRQVDPAHRGFGQTPFDVGQCRRDCPEFRAVEDRLLDIGNFLFAQRPQELYEAHGLRDRDELVSQLEQEYGEGAVERGRQTFASTCAGCHSSQPGPYTNVDFWEASSQDPTLRIDWLGNDKLEPAAEIGTFSGRALHSNHMQGHVWEEYGSETMRAKPSDPSLPGPSDGGRGYYRNISLLSAWAHAPFMHNNAVGPELCGTPQMGEDTLYSSPYVDGSSGEPLASGPACWPFDPSVDGRMKVYLASMNALLNPDDRIPKVSPLDHEIILDIGPRLRVDDSHGAETGISIRIPKGMPATRLGSLRHKELIDDLVIAAAQPEAIVQKYGQKNADALRALLLEVLADPSGAIDTLFDHAELIRALYSNDTEIVENGGHRFGEDLSDAAKRDLTAFLATL
jgi:hypothetical protein